MCAQRVLCIRVVTGGSGAQGRTELTAVTCVTSVQAVRCTRVSCVPPYSCRHGDSRYGYYAIPTETQRAESVAVGREDGTGLNAGESHACTHVGAATSVATGRIGSRCRARSRPLVPSCLRLCQCSQLIFSSPPNTETTSDRMRGSCNSSSARYFALASRHCEHASPKKSSSHKHAHTRSPRTHALSLATHAHTPHSPRRSSLVRTRDHAHPLERFPHANLPEDALVVGYRFDCRHCLLHRHLRLGHCGCALPRTPARRTADPPPPRCCHPARRERVG